MNTWTNTNSLKNIWFQKNIITSMEQGVSLYADSPLISTFNVTKYDTARHYMDATWTETG
jgi:hypothetical protein